MSRLRLVVVMAALLAGASTSFRAAAALQPKDIDAETLRHFQALLRVDTTEREEGAAQYLEEVLEKDGIPVETFTLEPGHPNVVARLKGSGKKRPILLMAHTDVVNVDAKKWTFPPFSGTRDSGYVYGRGSVDDKDNVVAALMVMLRLKRANVPLERDVIFLAEAGEEGNTRVGIQFLVEKHYPAIDAEYCFAEGGNPVRIGGEMKYASVQTLEKIPRAIELVARGTSGHGSIPLQSNAVVHLAKAVAAIGAWRPPVRLNDTTRAYFTRLAGVSTPEQAARYRAIVGTDATAIDAADAYFAASEARHASMLRTSVSPNIMNAGYRVNVIPSEGTATLDVRTLPDEDPAQFLESIRKVVNDPAIEVRYGQRDVRPGTNNARLDSEAFKVLEAANQKHYGAITLPTMSPGATDMAYLRAKGMQCYGVGPAIDAEDGPKGFGAHSDQERILEQELHRFVQFHYDIVVTLAGAPKS